MIAIIYALGVVLVNVLYALTSDRGNDEESGNVIGISLFWPIALVVAAIVGIPAAIQWLTRKVAGSK